MWCSRWMWVLAAIPMCAFATTNLGLLLQPQECQDTRLYFKLLLWGPVVEELVFRAGLQKWLTQKTASPLVANSVTSAVFALVHYVISGNPASLAVFMPSLALGWAYQKTNSIVWTTGMHMLFNLVFLLLMC
jgi:membrane protease YdiL (CAAX protease family)